MDMTFSLTAEKDSEKKHKRPEDGFAPGMTMVFAINANTFKEMLHE